MTIEIALVYIKMEQILPPFSPRLKSSYSMSRVQECSGRVRHHRGEAHCTRCGPGYGVLERCSRGHDTRCGECQPGVTYSPHHGLQPCWICSRCGPGLYEARRCRTDSDTLCDSCHRRPSPDDEPANEDYRSKCLGVGGNANSGVSGGMMVNAGANRLEPFLAPEDARQTNEQSALVNQDDDGLEPNELPDERPRLLWEDARAQMRDDLLARERLMQRER
ncbi:hypothetical protein QAD02_012203 [Eretmocerus hayati]|uniref:Uncharacterized protein n=1 Tax=Eretmocerus hayati TaxID=131215 RepID=A0ACC2NZ28_9HYME|nr:hypothetical protein QAD02_012203 [Eretmocerus hayati]